MVERYYGHLAPKALSDAIAKLPRLASVHVVEPCAIAPAPSPAGTEPKLPTAQTLSPPQGCVTGVPPLAATSGAYGAHGASRARPAAAEKQGFLVEKRRVSGGEGSRTRTYNQRIKSPMLYH